MGGFKHLGKFSQIKPFLSLPKLIAMYQTRAIMQIEVSSDTGCCSRICLRNTSTCVRCKRQLTTGSLANFTK